MILEALARQVPVAVSERVSAAAALVEHGVARLLRFREGEIVGLEDVLSDIESSGPAMRERCRVTHSDHFSPNAWLEKIEPIYEALAG